MSRAILLSAVAVLLLVAACSSGSDGASPSTGVAPSTTAAPAPSSTTAAAEPLPAAYRSHRSETYEDLAHWLCLPDRADDACKIDLDATSVTADGKLRPDPHEAAADPAIDCFYVYPTISSDPTVTSDLVPDAPERNVIGNQVARLSSTCRVFAPVYRQRTLSGLFGTAEPDPPGIPADVGYTDVLDAFRDYVANRSEGRGFVLVGHSQGTGLLARLIKEEIDTVPALRERMISAILAGGSIAVPDIDAEVGGTFENIPLCQSQGQIHCVISFASFRSTAPPPANSFFGKPRDGEGVAACTNPAQLTGGSAELHPYFQRTGFPGLTDPAEAAAITTPWVTAPGLLTGECVFENGFSYLEITVHGDPDDPRSDDIKGEITPPWGLHLVDMNLVMGDLEKAVAAQAREYVG